MNHFESEAVSTPENRKAVLLVLLGNYFYNTEALRLRARVLPSRGRRKGKSK